MLLQRRGGEHHDWALYGGAGRVQIEWYFKKRIALGPQVMLYHLEPGAEEGEHFHLHGDPDSCSIESEDEFYLCVAGEVEMTVDDEVQVLHPGDAVYVPVGARHGVRNASSAPAELVLLFGPPRPAPDVPSEP